MRIPYQLFLLTLLIGFATPEARAVIQATGESESASVETVPADTAARPPATPPFDGYDALALPFRVATFPIALLGKAVAWGIGALTRPGPPPFYMIALRDISDWGLQPGVGTIGPRSGFTGRLDLVRFEPLFVQTAFSIRESQRHRLGLRFAGEGRSGGLSYTFTRHAQPHFWGVGPNTPETARSDYLWDRQELVLFGRARLASVLTVEGDAALEDNRVGRGFDDDRPDIQDSFNTDTLFGGGERTRYFRFDLAGTLDLTRWYGLQRRGIWLRLGGSLYSGTDGTESDFHRLEGEGHVYLPLNHRQQLALRTLATLNRGDSGGGVPFTHLATVGSREGNRGFSTGRFRDRDMAAAMAEWRYEVWRDLHERGRVEMFVFLDESGVERSLSELDSSDLHTGYGFGMRINWLQDFVMVWYLGLSEETTRLRANLNVHY